MRKIFPILLALCAYLSAPVPALANALMPKIVLPPNPEALPGYDQDRTLILDGFIKSIDWSGPRLRIVFHWINGYEGLDWEVVGPDPAVLLQRGWTKDSIKVNERIDAVVHPKSDGSQSGELIRFYFNDGSSLETRVQSSTQIVPRDILERTFATAADDPMANYYGNTLAFHARNPNGPSNANYSGRLWYYADHTLVMYSVDLDSNGEYQGSLNYGNWYLEEYNGQWTICILFNFAGRIYCHSPVNFEKVGDSWDILFHGRNADWIEHRELQAGHK